MSYTDNKCLLCNGTGKIKLPNGFTKPCDCDVKKEVEILTFEDYYKKHFTKQNNNPVLGPNTEFKLPLEIQEKFKVEHSILRTNKCTCLSVNNSTC